MPVKKHLQRKLYIRKHKDVKITGFSLFSKFLRNHILLISLAFFMFITVLSLSSTSLTTGTNAFMNWGQLSKLKVRSQVILNSMENKCAEAKNFSCIGNYPDIYCYHILGGVCAGKNGDYCCNKQVELSKCPNSCQGREIRAKEVKISSCDPKRCYVPIRNDITGKVTYDYNLTPAEIATCDSIHQQECTFANDPNIRTECGNDECSIPVQGGMICKSANSCESDSNRGANWCKCVPYARDNADKKGGGAWVCNYKTPQCSDDNPQDCRSITNIGECNRAGCAWYSCGSNSCAKNGTSRQDVCPKDVQQPIPTVPLPTSPPINTNTCSSGSPTSVGCYGVFYGGDCALNGYKCVNTSNDWCACVKK